MFDAVQVALIFQHVICTSFSTAIVVIVIVTICKNKKNSKDIVQFYLENKSWYSYCRKKGEHKILINNSYVGPNTV